MKKLLLCLLTISCSTTNVEKTTLNVAVPIEATGLYPYTANDPHSSRVNVLLYDTLIQRNTNGDIIPALAESWEIIDSRTLDFTIRTNVTFHNGDMLTLDDVQYSFEQILASPNLAHTVGPIAGTEITPEGKFRVNLKMEYAPILPLLSFGTFKIVNKAFVESNRQNISQYPMGTGPFKLKEWSRGQNIVLERHDTYWGQVAQMQFINLRTVTDPVSRAIALETGDVDIAYDIEGSDRDRIIENSELSLVSREIPRVEYIAMNIGKGTNPLWKDKRGRQAFVYALDLEGIVNSVLFGMGKPANSLLSPVIDGFDENLPKRQRDVEKSKALLAEMGMTNVSMTMWVREGISQKVGEVIQANLREVGITVNLETIEYARFLEGIANGQHDTFLLNWSTITVDADYGLNNLLNSHSWGSKGNRSFYSNQIIDNLLEKGRSTIDQHSRELVYKEIQEIVYDEVPYIPIYYVMLGVGMNKKIQGFEFDPVSDHRLNTVYIAQ